MRARALRTSDKCAEVIRVGKSVSDNDEGSLASFLCNCEDVLNSAIFLFRCHSDNTLMGSKSYREMFDFAPPEQFSFRACGLNCGCYFMPFSKWLPPKIMGPIFEGYLPEDYLPWVPSLKAQKYITKDFPPAFVMSARYDYLRFMAPMLHRLLRRKGVESILRIYGRSGQKEMGHVFHLKCKLETAALCNDEQCAFFRAHMAK